MLYIKDTTSTSIRSCKPVSALNDKYKYFYVLFVLVLLNISLTILSWSHTL